MYWLARRTDKLLFHITAVVNMTRFIVMGRFLCQVGSHIVLVTCVDHYDVDLTLNLIVYYYNYDKTATFGGVNYLKNWQTSYVQAGLKRYLSLSITNFFRNKVQWGPLWRAEVSDLDDFFVSEVFFFPEFCVQWSALWVTSLEVNNQITLSFLWRQTRLHTTFFFKFADNWILLNNKTS